MVRNIVGSPARGSDFFDREDFLDFLWSRLGTDNVLLAAPRRFGKTSVMYKLIDEPRPGWRPVHVDAESIREPVNFVIALLDALTADQKLRRYLVSAWQGGSSRLREFFDGWEVTTPWDVGLKISLKEALRDKWQERAEELLNVLTSYDQGEKLLIVIDELPVMLHLFEDNDVSDADARVFLYWFRKVRTDPRVGLSACRFLVGGSIGIDRYLSRLRAVDAFNDFNRMALPLLPEGRGDELMAALLKDHGLSGHGATRRHMLALIGPPIPYFIQLFVDRLAAAASERHAGTVDRGLVDSVYQQDVLGPVSKGYFQHYYDRLRHYNKPEEAAAKELLKQLALAEEQGVARDQPSLTYRREMGEAATHDDFAQLLADLENDFYIVYRHEDERYVFACKILCDWWRRYYAF